MRSLRLLRAGAGCAALLALPAAPALASEGGIVLIPQWPLLLPLLVLFGVLILPVQQLIFKPIFRVLDEREERIGGTRHRAGQLEKQADAVLARYDTAVREARHEAELARRQRLEAARGDVLATTGAARRDAEGEIERARHALAQSLESARGTLRGQADELAREAAARVLGRAL